MSGPTHKLRKPRDVTSSHRVGLDLEQTSRKLPTSLQHLHGHAVEVLVDVGDTVRSVRGECLFDSGDPDLGRVLRVLVADAAGDFELLIPEISWDGASQPGSLPDCRFRISLANSVPSIC